MKPDNSGKKPRRKRIEPRELLRRRGVIFEAEVEEWLRSGRLYVFRDAAGEPRAFYASEELMEAEPWWVEDRQREHERRRLLEETRRGQRRGSVDTGTGEARRELRELLDKLGSG